MAACVRACGRVSMLRVRATYKKYGNNFGAYAHAPLTILLAKTSLLWRRPCLYLSSEIGLHVHIIP